uniref:Uncharacterized protein n=1 Tax=Kalanchoe fedtschenkoi TaxID=63787 RepID=A0A7N0VDI1_KALFE
MSMSSPSSSSQATTTSKWRRYGGNSALAISLARSTIFLPILSLCLGNMLLKSRQLPYEML